MSGSASTNSFGQAHLAKQFPKTRVFMQCLKFLSQLDEIQPAESAFKRSIQPFESFGSLSQGRVNSSTIVRCLEIGRVGERAQFSKELPRFDLPPSHGVQGAPESLITQLAHFRFHMK